MYYYFNICITYTGPRVKKLIGKLAMTTHQSTSIHTKKYNHRKRKGCHSDLKQWSLSVSMNMHVQLQRSKGRNRETVVHIPPPAILLTILHIRYGPPKVIAINTINGQLDLCCVGNLSRASAADFFQAFAQASSESPACLKRNSTNILRYSNRKNRNMANDVATLVNCTLRLQN